MKPDVGDRLDEVVLCNPIRREINRGAMTAWIAHHNLSTPADPDEVIVFYDSNVLFAGALRPGVDLTPELAHELHVGGVRYWSTGVVG